MQDAFMKEGEESREVELENGILEVISKKAREEGETGILKKQLIKIIMWSVVLCLTSY